MAPQIEVFSGARSWRVELLADRTAVGKAVENDIAIDEDPTASRLHAVLERFAAGWCVSDLGSANGTWVNGERIWASRALRSGDEIRIGQTRLVFRDPLAAAGAVTEAEQAPPSLTVRERDVLVALCRPLMARDMFTEPASTRVIADELVITQAAVKQHLVNLYDKFGVAPGDDHRRARLANEALRRGAVSLNELRPEHRVGRIRAHRASISDRRTARHGPSARFLPARRQDDPRRRASPLGGTWPPGKSGLALRPSD